MSLKKQIFTAEDERISRDSQDKPQRTHGMDEEIINVLSQMSAEKIVMQSTTH